MMYRKLHITGRNNPICKGLALLLGILLLLSAVPLSASADTPESKQTISPADLTDLDPNEWYYEETCGAIEAGLFEGNGDGLFGVNDNITRAQFVAVLNRLFADGSASQPKALPQGITDVTKKDWYHDNVAWAYANGITNGISATEFGPERNISRQEMCKMFGSAIETLTGTTISKENALVFADESAIEDWALEWVKKCSSIKLFKGDEDGNFLPADSATRVEAACVFFRHYDANLLSSLTVSGFDLSFTPDKDYYLCQPADFDNCKILSYEGLGKMTVTVEQYATNYPYKNTPYVFGDALKLGNGRAKVTLSFAGSSKEYLIVLTDPDALDYAYARARVSGTVNLRAEPNTNSAILATFYDNARVYYLKTEGDWCMVEQLYTGTIGYIHKNYLRWEWLETEMPAQYTEEIAALQTAHPNWTFTFVDVEMTYAEALEKYGTANEQYINPLNYLNETNIFAFLDIDSYDQETWNDSGIRAIWANEKGISKDDAVSYFNAASKSLLMNPYYIACRAALESGYGTSKFATGTVPGYEGYYNFFGIQCYDSNPSVGAQYAKDRNWSTVERSIIEGANWMKDQYLDQGAITPYFFRYRGFQNKVYMSDVLAPLKEADILRRAFTAPDAKAHFIVPVYRELPAVPVEDPSAPTDLIDPANPIDEKQP